MSIHQTFPTVTPALPADPRIAELHEHALVTGIPLPLPASVIAALEDQGRLVDLRTGVISNAPAPTWTPAERQQRKSIALTLLVLVLALAMLWPAPAQAYPMACRAIPHGQQCVSSTTGLPLARCDRGYAVAPGLRCVKAPEWMVQPIFRVGG